MLPYGKSDIDKNKTSELINELVERCKVEGGKDILRQILLSVIKLGGNAATEKGDLKLINNTLKELRRAFAAFSDFRSVRKVTIFGSSRVDKDSADYLLARDFANEVVRHGFMVITGAGGGIMEAGNEGAGGGNSFGVNIKLPFEQKPNQFIIDDPKCITFKYFFTRKLTFTKESDVTVLLPGGFGTMDEAFESLTLFQTGKCRPRPIILLDPEGSNFWDEWLSFVKTKLKKRGLISQSDMNLFSHHHNITQAVNEIREFYKVYKSIQYVGDDTILYLTRSINEDMISSIKREFKDIISGEKMEIVTESGEIDRKNIWASVPYLQFRFARNDFGRLTEMIRHINRNG